MPLNYASKPSLPLRFYRAAIAAVAISSLPAPEEIGISTALTANGTS
jgi:hypothetical protein